MLNNSTILICPVCANPLNQNDKSYACLNHHTFDKAKQGYVNLLLANQKNSLQPGDNKEMVASRLAFLKKGYYLSISEALNRVIYKTIGMKTPNNDLQIADLGCGVGYYLSALKKYLSLNECLAEYWGIDISKEAIHAASQYDKTISWLVGSTNTLPFAPQSLDILLSVFAPIYVEEIKRILAPNGKIFVITPASSHLLELRKLLFDQVKEGDFEKIVQKMNGFFELIDTVPLQYSIHLSSKNEIENLLKMTPFYWKSNLTKKTELLALNELAVTIDINIWIFQHKPLKIISCF